MSYSLKQFYVFFDPLDSLWAVYQRVDLKINGKRVAGFPLRVDAVADAERRNNL
jgi:hypothetical protein